MFHMKHSLPTRYMRTLLDLEKWALRAFIYHAKMCAVNDLGTGGTIVYRGGHLIVWYPHDLGGRRRKCTGIDSLTLNLYGWRRSKTILQRRGKAQ